MSAIAEIRTVRERSTEVRPMAGQPAARSETAAAGLPPVGSRAHPGNGQRNVQAGNVQAAGAAASPRRRPPGALDRAPRRSGARRSSPPGPPRSTSGARTPAPSRSPTPPASAAPSSTATSATARTCARPSPTTSSRPSSTACCPSSTSARRARRASVITAAIEVIVGWLDEHPNLYRFLRSRRDGAPRLGRDHPGRQRRRPAQDDDDVLRHGQPAGRARRLRHRRLRRGHRRLVARAPHDVAGDRRSS